MEVADQCFDLHIESRRHISFSLGICGSSFQLQVLACALTSLTVVSPQGHPLKSHIERSYTGFVGVLHMYCYDGLGFG